MNNILKKYEKGCSSFINPKNIENTTVKKSEKRVPSHIRDKIREFRRSQLHKIGIKKILENEGYVRIKYIRYADDFLLGVDGSLRLITKI
jgi:hypothetical protein